MSGPGCGRRRPRRASPRARPGPDRRSPPAASSNRLSPNASGAALRRPRCNISVTSGLLQLDAGAGLLELALQLLALVAVHGLLDGLGRLVDERLGLLEAEARGGTDDLDHLDLLLARAGEDDVDRRRLLLGSGTVTGATGGGRGGGDRGRGHSELLLERLDQLGQLEYRHLLDLIDQLCSSGHGPSLFRLVALGGRISSISLSPVTLGIGLRLGSSLISSGLLRGSIIGLGRSLLRGRGVLGGRVAAHQALVADL